MRLLLALLMLPLFAQKLPPVMRASGGGGGGGGSVPAFVLSQTDPAPSESAAARAKGTCWTNVHAVTQCAITDQTTIPPGTPAYTPGASYSGPPAGSFSFVTHNGKVWQSIKNLGTTHSAPSESNTAEWMGVIWAHGYTMPIPLNSNNSWVLLGLGSPDGTQFLFRLGTRTSTTIEVFGPYALPTQSGAGNQRIFWDANDPKRGYTFAQGGSAHHKLWRLQCGATCLTGSDWSWTMEKDFTSALSSIWTLPVFANLTDPANQVNVYGYSLSDDACKIAASLRVSTKREYGFIGYNRCTDTLAIRYSDVANGDGATESTVTPAFPAGVWLNAGGPCENSFQTCWTQYGARAGTQPGPTTYNAFFYRYAWPTSGTSALSAIPIVSLTGTEWDVGHGTLLWGGLLTFTAMSYEPGCQVSTACPPPEFEGQVYGLRVIPDTAVAPVPGDQNRVPWKDVMRWKFGWRQGGFHVGSSTRQNRSDWVVGTLYDDSGAAPLAHMTGARNEVWAIRTSTRALVSTTASTETMDRAGNIRRLAKHYTCALVSGACGHPSAGVFVDYAAQGHPSVSFDGSLFLYETSMNETSYTGGIQVVVGLMPGDITSTYP